MDCGAGAFVLIVDQAHLTRVDEGRGFGALPEIVIVRVEAPDEAVQVQRCFPDFEEQAATRAVASNGSGPVDGRIIGFVPGAAAFELAGSDLQRFFTYISRIAGPHIRIAGYGRSQGADM